MPRIPYKNLTQSDEMAEKLEMSTAEIGLSVRTTNCLEEKGIFTVHDLLNCTRADLLSISNFGEKTLEEVIGTSALQSFIVSYILKILYRNLEAKTHNVLTNKLGMYLNRKNNLCADIAIYEKTNFSVAQANKHYATVPPKIQIEVDVNADTENELIETYINKKTDKLFEFGVEKVIWILSDSKKIIVATPTANWEIIDWNKDIEVIDGVSFCIGKYLQEGGSPFA
jgi:Uma2 family endonuclease